MENNQKILTEFEKNNFESIRVGLVKYRGNKYVDLRIWVLGDQGDKDSRLPTRKGLRLHVELLSDLIQALQKAKGLIRKSFDKSSKKKS